jgi:hypothetical protein
VGNTKLMGCKSIVKITILKYINIKIKLNWVHLSLNFGEVVLSDTTQGWVCPNNRTIVYMFIFFYMFAPTMHGRYKVQNLFFSILIFIKIIMSLYCVPIDANFQHSRLNTISRASHLSPIPTFVMLYVVGVLMMNFNLTFGTLNSKCHN